MKTGKETYNFGLTSKETDPRAAELHRKIAEMAEAGEAGKNMVDFLNMSEQEERDFKECLAANHGKFWMIIHPFWHSYTKLENTDETEPRYNKRAEQILEFLKNILKNKKETHAKHPTVIVLEEQERIGKTKSVLSKLAQGSSIPAYFIPTYKSDSEPILTNPDTNGSHGFGGRKENWFHLLDEIKKRGGEQAYLVGMNLDLEKGLPDYNNHPEMIIEYFRQRDEMLSKRKNSKSHGLYDLKACLGEAVRQISGYGKIKPHVTNFTFSFSRGEIEKMEDDYSFDPKNDSFKI